MLAGKRILIVEDEPLIALDLETAVVDHHGTPVGPVATVSAATAMIDGQPIHGAILDLRLKDSIAIDLANELRLRGVPVILHSGQADLTLTAPWPAELIVPKPALPETVIVALAAAIDRCKL
jgi:DNA-binding response OmpR family regulator